MKISLWNKTCKYPKLLTIFCNNQKSRENSHWLFIKGTEALLT